MPPKRKEHKNGEKPYALDTCKGIFFFKLACNIQEVKYVFVIV